MVRSERSFLLFLSSSFSLFNFQSRIKCWSVVCHTFDPHLNHRLKRIKLLNLIIFLLHWNGIECGGGRRLEKGGFPSFFHFLFANQFLLLNPGERERDEEKMKVQGRGSLFLENESVRSFFRYQFIKLYLTEGERMKEKKQRKECMFTVTRWPVWEREER